MLGATRLIDYVICANKGISIRAVNSDRGSYGRA